MRAIFPIILLALVALGCSSQRPSPLPLASNPEFLSTPETPYGTNAAYGDTYLVAHEIGRQDFMRTLGKKLERNTASGDLARAQRDGYLAGVAQAYDEWQRRSRAKEQQTK